MRGPRRLLGDQLLDNLLLDNLLLGHLPRDRLSGV